MSQIQNTTLHNYVQPAVLIATGLLAGRFVTFFPEVSKGGLLLQSTLGAGAALASQKFASPEETVKASFLRAALSLGLAAGGSLVVSKALKGRVELSLNGAARLYGSQLVVSALLAAASHKISSKKPSFTVEELHDKYSKDLGAWKSLEEKKRTELVGKFYEKNLPPISLEGAPVDVRVFGDKFNFSEMSDNQIRWFQEADFYVASLPVEIFFKMHVEVLKRENVEMKWKSDQQVSWYFQRLEFSQIIQLNVPTHLYKLFAGKEDFSPAQLIALEMATESEDTFIWPIDDSCLEVLQKHKEALEHVHDQFQNAPIPYVAIPDAFKKRLDTLFEENTLSIIDVPSEDELDISAEQIRTLGSDSIWDFYQYYKKFNDRWQSLDKEKVTAFIKCWFETNNVCPPLEGVALDKEALRAEFKILPQCMTSNQEKMISKLQERNILD